MLRSVSPMEIGSLFNGSFFYKYLPQVVCSIPASQKVRSRRDTSLLETNPQCFYEGGHRESEWGSRLFMVTQRGKRIECNFMRMLSLESLFLFPLWFFWLQEEMQQARHEPRHADL